jgi:hypothetical protein
MTAAPEIGYRLVLPEGWWSIDLEPGRRERQVAALVEHQWRGVDDAPHLKAEARARIGRLAADAAAAGGLQLFLSVGAVAGIPLSASLLVTGVPVTGPEELRALGEAAATAGRDVSWPQLPAGSGLRTGWRQPPGAIGDPSPDDDLDAGLATTCIDLHVPVPGAQRVLLLQFRTQLEPLADALVELFDAVATTLRWTAPDDRPPALAAVAGRSATTEEGPLP